MKLDEAIYHAFKAHEGQVDKCGEDYIKHPLRVMRNLILKPWPSITPIRFGEWRLEDVLVVAVFHDVVEDTNYFAPCTANNWDDTPLVEKFDMNDAQVWALCSITKAPFPQETYKEYIKRLSKNPIAKIVKLADIEDNLYEKRQGCLNKSEAEGLAKRYKWAQEYLTGEK